MNLTDETIEQEKNSARLHLPNYEHNDCIRIAYQWLDAQVPTKGKRSADWKLIIERWGGRYVSDGDVEIAARLHAKIEGKYPLYNISKSLVLPSSLRLADIQQAGTQNTIMRVGRPAAYVSIEADR